MSRIQAPVTIRRAPQLPLDWLHVGWRQHRLLMIVAAVHVLAIPVLLAAMIADPKLINGVNGWIKPLKFAISIVVYSATFLWLTTYVRRWQRTVSAISFITAISLTVEFVLITVQVVRGTTSHFNVSTRFDAALFSLMGNFVVLISLMNLVLALLLLAQRLEDRHDPGGDVFAWSLRFGVLSAFIFGMGGGFLMTAGPTAAQMEMARQSGEMPYVGAHAVGVTDGGPGLPFVNWSTEGGDLRIGHFVGLHGMQVLPLLGFVLTLPATVERYPRIRRRMLIWLWSGGYLGATGILVWQALRGQSIIAPDRTTLCVTAAWLIAMVVPSAWLLAKPANCRLEKGSEPLRPLS